MGRELLQLYLFRSFLLPGNAEALVLPGAS